MKDKLLKIEDNQIEKHLTSLRGWTYEAGSLKKTFRTKDWRSTLMLTSMISYLCEIAWHHPKLELEYNSLTVFLCTHDVKGVSSRDFEVANKIDDIVDWEPRDHSGVSLTGLPEANPLLVDRD